MQGSSSSKFTKCTILNTTEKQISHVYFEFTAYTRQRKILQKKIFEMQGQCLVTF